MLFRDDKSLIVTITAFDKQGTWIDSSGRFPGPGVSAKRRSRPNEILESRVIGAHGRRRASGPKQPALLTPSCQAFDLTKRRTVASVGLGAGIPLILDTYADLFDDDLNAVSDLLDDVTARRVTREN